MQLKLQEPPSPTTLLALGPSRLDSAASPLCSWTLDVFTEWVLNTVEVGGQEGRAFPTPSAPWFEAFPWMAASLYDGRPSYHP